MIEQIKRCTNDPGNIILTRAEIAAKVEELAQRISEDYAGKTPVLECVLNGSFLFYADLVRELSINSEVDFLKISSYANALKSSGDVKIHKAPDCDIRGRDVIVVEDIIDTGLSVFFLRKWLMEQSPKSLKFVSLLIKNDSAQVDYECEYYGFRIPNKFVIGYGLDYAQQFRALPDIYAVETS